MNFEDILIPPAKILSEKWQLGSKFSNEIPEAGIALIFCSDYRGTKLDNAEMLDFRPLRKQLYKLSALDFEVPLADLGDLVSGKSHEDTHYILQEVLSACFAKNTVPVVIGGGVDLALSLFSALNFHQKDLILTHISNTVALENDGEEISENNFLPKIFSNKEFSLKNFHLLGYQKHMNDIESLKLMIDVDFDVVRLADMMNSTEKTEPFFRRADLVTVNCDAVESFADDFSINPQVNGLNRREVCAYMKEAGLSENLKCAGIFNFNFENSRLNDQLLAQMIWHLVEGINIRKSHPEEKNFETFWLMIGDREYAFQRDTFSNLWYFGDDENDLIPCSHTDYEDAKRGFLNARFLKF